MNRSPFPSFLSKTPTKTVGQNYQSVIMMLVISLLFIGGIGSRLAYLQLIEGEKNKALAENNRIRIIPKPPIRGTIFDRRGKILASTKLSQSVFVWPQARNNQKWPEIRKKLSIITQISETEIQAKIEQEDINTPTLIRIARGISPEQITALAEYSSQLLGVEVDIEPVRYYPYGETASHLLGYTGEISDSELKQRRTQGYRLGDIVGKMGIEDSFESRLRGEWGGKQIEVNGEGKAIKILGEKKPRAGQDIKLTIDIELQKSAEQALGYRRGAIVVMNPNNGEVLALASYPRFDPNIFSSRISESTWKELQSRDHPFVNRAIRVFPPASTFKIVTTTAALESGKFSPDTYLQTYPALTIGGVTFGEWNKAGFGPLNFTGAMAWSSDTFFYQIAKGIGGEILIDWTRKYGFGEKTGIELPEELKGLVADDAWKQKRFKSNWTIGDTVNMSIGQGYLQTSPLQQAVMFAVPANGGYRVQPHLLKEDQSAKERRKSLNLKPVTLDILRRGLRSVITYGTGKKANASYLPPIAGKTGTAEAPPGKSHAWFGCYAPYDHPQVVVLVFAEHSGGGGGKVAAPIAVEVLANYFRLYKK